MTTCLNCGHADDRDFAFCPTCGTKAPEAGQGTNPLIGRTLRDKYRVVSEIGSGAMGTVYTGEHVGLKKKVALKVLHPDLLVSDEQLQRFQREGIAAGKFNHPNAIQIFDFDKSEEGIIYLAMEFVEGGNLREFLAKKKKLPVAVAIQLTRQILGCLAEAHRVGIIHRDLKPDNIMVVPGSRGEVRIKVLDFGLSKLVDLAGAESSLVTQAGRILGTPLYMAPEQCSGDDTDARSDLYAVGLILYEMLSGQRPFPEESTSDLLFSRVTKEAPSMREQIPDCEISAELDAVLMKCMQRRREDRYQLAEDVMAALESVPLSGSSWNVSGTSVMTSTDQVARHRASLEQSAQDHQLESASGGKGEGGGLKLLLSALGITIAVGLLMAGIAFGVLSIGGGEGGGEEVAQPEVPAVLRASEKPEIERTKEESLYVQQLNFARMSLASGSPEQARNSIAQALLSTCVDSEAYLLQAEMFAAMGDKDAALASYKAALDEDPNYLAAVLGQGWLRLDAGELDSARESFKRAADLTPDAPDVAAALGVLAWREGEELEAQQQLERALIAEPNNTLALTYMGRLLLDKGDLVRAIDSLVDAKRGDPNSWRAFEWLGDAYLADNREQEAEQQWSQALNLRESVELRRKQGTLLVEGARYTEAERFLSEALSKFPRDGRLFALEGVVEFEAGRIAAAKSALQQALALGEDDGHTRTLLAMVLHADGDLTSAIETYRGVVEDLGDLPSANLGLGLAYFETQKYAEAQACFLKVLDYDPRHLSAHFHLGLLHMDFLDNADDSQRAALHFGEYQRYGGTDARVGEWLLRL